MLLAATLTLIKVSVIWVTVSVLFLFPTLPARSFSTILCLALAFRSHMIVGAALPFSSPLDSLFVEIGLPTVSVGVGSSPGHGALDPLTNCVPVILQERAERAL